MFSDLVFLWYMFPCVCFLYYHPHPSLFVGFLKKKRGCIEFGVRGGREDLRGVKDKEKHDKNMLYEENYFQ